jgi:hypothetical protein
MPIGTRNPTAFFLRQIQAGQFPESSNIKLKELADTAVFIASDGVDAIIGTVINLSCGKI